MHDYNVTHQKLVVLPGNGSFAYLSSTKIMDARSSYIVQYGTILAILVSIGISVYVYSKCILCVFSFYFHLCMYA